MCASSRLRLAAAWLLVALAKVEKVNTPALVFLNRLSDLLFVIARVLARQERDKGFTERSRHAKRFFRSGSAGGWKAVLKPPEVDLIVRHHAEVMGELGYLGAGGTPKV